MRRFKVGYHFYQQHATMAELRRMWKDVDGLGVDSLWPWDHFFPLYGDPGGASYDGWTLLAATVMDYITAKGTVAPEIEGRIVARRE